MSSLHLDMIPIEADDPALRQALLEAHLPAGDLEEPGRLFFRFDHDGATIGFGGLEWHGADVLLRSVVIAAEHRGRGLGRDITRALIEQAKAEGASAIYLLTETATAFFGHLGFAAIDRATAPPAILATRQAAELCPASATLMMLELAP